VSLDVAESVVTLVAVCPDANYDATTGACSQVVFVDSSVLGGPLPSLSETDAMQIGTAIALVWMFGACWRWIGRALD